MNAWSLVVFCLTVAAVLYLVIAEPAVTIPAKWVRRDRNVQISISYGYAPLLGVLTLLAAGAANGDTLKRGIVGDKFIKPYGIVILFMSQAYLCVSLDHTGVFAYIAAQVTRKAGTGGHKVFAAYFALASLLTVATSNDVVILTLTPIVCHFAKATRTDPAPLLFLEFYAANIWGMVLLIGNPTNIILGEAADLPFLEFSKWSVLPSVVTGAVAYLVLVLYFRKHIQNVPEYDDSNEPSTLLTDRWGAKFGGAVLVLSLALLAAANYFGAPLWTITLGAAVVLVAGNAYMHYFRPWLLARRHPRRQPSPPLPQQQQQQGLAGAAAATANGGTADSCSAMASGTSLVRHSGGADRDTAAATQPRDAAAIEVVILSEPVESQPTSQAAAQAADSVAPAPADSQQQQLPNSSAALRRRNSLRAAGSSGGGGGGAAALVDGSCGISSAPDEMVPASSVVTAPSAASSEASQEAGFSLWRTFVELPWHVVPFLFGMFIIVEALNQGGWVDYFGKALAGATNSLFAAVFLTGAIGSVLANVVNNQPMTILMARVLLSRNYNVSARSKLAANLSLVAASNVGSNFTLIGSLAAVMWVKLLKAKGVPMPFFKFFVTGLITMLLPLAACLLVFWAEVARFPH